MKKPLAKERFSLREGLLCSLALAAVILLCVCVGSVSLPLKDSLSAIGNGLTGNSLIGNSLIGNGLIGNGLTGNGSGAQTQEAVILLVRLPRVLCVALVGASLSICGAAMQGLLRNPLADSSTLGVSSGASVGAVVAIAFGLTFPGLPFAGTMVMAILFAFLSMMLILSLAYRLDNSLSTNTIILIGVIFSMFATSLISFFTVFAQDKVKTITFWTMGSLAGSNYANALILLAALLLCGGIFLRYAGELNAFAVGEDNARHVGVDVKRVKLVIMIAVSVLTGVCVSIGGSIGFVGLVIPHMTRMLVGPNHRRLLPYVLFFGAIFLLLADLLSRVVLRPMELPIGVVTSFVGSITFVYIFYTQRKGR